MARLSAKNRGQIYANGREVVRKRRPLPTAEELNAIHREFWATLNARHTSEVILHLEDQVLRARAPQAKGGRKRAIVLGEEHAERDRRIRAANARGMTPAQIAETVGLSVSQVRRILGRSRR